MICSTSMIGIYSHKIQLLGMIYLLQTPYLSKNIIVTIWSKRKTCWIWAHRKCRQTIQLMFLQKIILQARVRKTTKTSSRRLYSPKPNHFSKCSPTLEKKNLKAITLHRFRSRKRKSGKWLIGIKLSRSKNLNCLNKIKCCHFEFSFL